MKDFVKTRRAFGEWFLGRLQSRAGNIPAGVSLARSAPPRKENKEKSQKPLDILLPVCYHSHNLVR